MLTVRDFVRVILAICVCAGCGGTPGVIAAEPVDETNFGVETPLPESLYALLDPNGDGEITDDEAEQAAASFQKLARSKHPLAADIRKSLDADGNRTVDADEARLGVARGKAHYRGVAVEVSEVVKHLDIDGDEKISVTEFRGLLQELGPLAILVGPKLAQFFNGMDMDRDGFISLVEAQRGADYLRQQIEQNQQAQELRRKIRDPLYQQAARAIAAYDRNKDLQLSDIEARKNKQAADLFLAADMNGDSLLSIDELYDHLKLLRDEARGNQPKVEFLPKEKLQVKKK